MRPLLPILTLALLSCGDAASKVDAAAAKVVLPGMKLGEKLASEEGLKKIDLIPGMDPEALGAATAMDGFTVVSPAPLEVCGVAWKPNRSAVFVERATSLLVQTIHVADASCNDLMDACVAQLGQPARNDTNNQRGWLRFEGDRARLRIVSLEGLEGCTVLVQHREGIDRVERVLASAAPSAP